jgi:hypothetical protein
LATDAPALHDAFHFELVEHLRELERLDRSRMPRNVAKIFIYRPAIYSKARRSHLDVHARD